MPIINDPTSIEHQTNAEHAARYDQLKHETQVWMDSLTEQRDAALARITRLESALDEQHAGTDALYGEKHEVIKERDEARAKIDELQARVDALSGAAKEAQEILVSDDPVSIAEAVNEKSRRADPRDLSWWGLALKASEVIEHINAALAAAPGVGGEAK